MARPLYFRGGGQGTTTKRFKASRLQTQAKNNLGTIMTDDMATNQVFRDDNLDVFDAYYENRQYDHLMDWEEAVESEQYVPIRKRRPRIMYNVAKLVAHKVAGKITGTAVFPTFVVEDDPDDTAFFRVVQKAVGFRRNLIDAMVHFLLSGSVFIRFYVVEGSCCMEWHNAKFCYPKFDAKGSLLELEIKYIYEDTDDLDSSGKARWKWYRMMLTQTSDTLFDNPFYRPGVKPEFQVVENVPHELGWVQGEWLRTVKKQHDPDGDSIFVDVLPFIDDLNYSLSQTSQAVGYNQEPQLGVNGVDEDELEGLIKSSQKAWDLGREGKAEFIESSMKGVETAEAQRDHMRNLMFDVIRVVLHDPEKMAASAQSGRALEILNAPLVELVDEIRTMIEPSLVNLLIKMGLTLLELEARGEETMLDVPKGYMPASLDITTNWPPIYPPTLEDLNSKVGAASAAAGAMLISRESLTRWLAGDFGIENVEEELEKLAAEPVLNPFGSFGGG